MTHGGKREGAGRKIGTRSRASVEREKRVAASGATPLERLCASTVLTQEDLGDIIIAAASGKFDLNHRREIRNLLPDDMELHRDDLAKIDPLNNPQKLIARLGAIFDHPRKLIAHFFWCDNHVRWWLIVFNYKEMNRWRNGWKEGPHVHMVSYLTHPRASPNDFLEEIM
jgi:hypothetical protein